jgi:hypothetical protein
VSAPDTLLPAWQAFEAAGVSLSIDTAGHLVARPREKLTDELRALAKLNKRDLVLAARGLGAARQALQRLGRSEADLAGWWDGRDYWALGRAIEAGEAPAQVLGCMRAALESAAKYAPAGGRR